MTERPSYDMNDIPTDPEFVPIAEVLPVLRREDLNVTVE